jgi:hypothetical protein
MPKGGARTKSGPQPDPNALRRERDQGEWIELPPEGRSGPVPAWPLPEDVRTVAVIEMMERKAIELRDLWAAEEDGRKASALARKLDATERSVVEMRAVLAMVERLELDLWAELWALPQACMWERQSQNLEVAIYCRRLCEAQERGSAVNLSTLVRQMADSLGLTTPGLRANRWRIERAKEPAKDKPARRSSARDRLTVVAGGGA